VARTPQRKNAGASLHYRMLDSTHPAPALAMHLVLALPGLLAPSVARDRAAPHLARLLALAGTPEREADGLDPALAARYGIRRASDWPLAAIRASALGIDTGTAYWLRADPVALEAGSNDVQLQDAVRDLDPADSAALVAALNAHFAGDGITFVAPRADTWFVRGGIPIALSTRPLAVVAGRMVRDFMASGPDAGQWRRWQSEIEMLLHTHPVNAAREAQGKRSVNGVWLSEGGVATPAATGSVRTFAESGIAGALARHAGAPAAPVPVSLDAALGAAADAAMVVVVLPAQIDLARLDDAWAQPAWNALARSRLATIAIIADGGGDALVWTARPPGPWQRIARSFARGDLARALAATREPI
jgi:hypothetical protein